jgi:hypothetical protein
MTATHRSPSAYGLDDLGALGCRCLEGLLEVLDEDVRPHPALAGDLVLGAEMADDVAASVLERRVVAVSAHRPAEDRLVEGGQGLRISSRDPQVRDPAGPEDRVLAHHAIIHMCQ